MGTSPAKKAPATGRNAIEGPTVVRKKTKKRVRRPLKIDLRTLDQEIRNADVPEEGVVAAELRAAEVVAALRHLPRLLARIERMRHVDLGPERRLQHVLAAVALAQTVAAAQAVQESEQELSSL